MFGFLICFVVNPVSVLSSTSEGSLVSTANLNALEYEDSCTGLAMEIVINCGSRGAGWMLFKDKSTVVEVFIGQPAPNDPKYKHWHNDESEGRNKDSRMPWIPNRGKLELGGTGWQNHYLDLLTGSLDDPDQPELPPDSLYRLKDIRMAKGRKQKRIGLQCKNSQYFMQDRERRYKSFRYANFYNRGG